MKGLARLRAARPTPASRSSTSSASSSSFRPRPTIQIFSSCNSQKTVAANGPSVTNNGARRESGSRRAHIKPKAKAKARAFRAQQLGFHINDDYLKHRSVSGRTPRIYQLRVQEFNSWASEKNLAISPSSEFVTDRAMAAYFNCLFTAGHGINRPRYTLYGWSYVHDVSVQRPHFPMSHRRLKGWTRASPESAGDPMPWEGAILFALLAAGPGLALFGQCALHAARAMLVQFDAYLRSEGLFDVDTLEIVAPQADQPCWSLVIHPSNPAEGGADDLLLLGRNQGLRKASKQGIFDNAVLIGQAPSIAAGRGCITTIVAFLKSGRHLCPRARAAAVRRGFVPAFPLDPAKYREVVRWCHKELGIPVLPMTPHAFRHGGASADAFLETRSIDMIKERGLWAHPRSVARYKKPARYLKMLSSIPAAQQARARASLSSLVLKLTAPCR